MTTYYNLPVYKQSYDLLLEIFKLTKEFNREYKYTIGEELKKETTAMIINWLLECGIWLLACSHIPLMLK